MANNHSSFQEFNQLIRLTENRRQALISARNDLRDRITKGFNSGTVGPQLTTVKEVQFQSQGSFVMDTIINPISEDYDLDDGVYFIGAATSAQRPATKLFHDFVYNCVSTNNPNVKEVKDKETCVRAFYREGFGFLYENKSQKLSKGFHVDLPMYYAGNKKSPDLAHLKKSWILSDPIQFIKWFEDKVKSNFKSEFLYERKLFSAQYEAWRDIMRKTDAQLRRIVRYLKAWCDYQGADMPCGIVLTILAAENYKESERDDISLKETLVKIKAALDKDFVCSRPTPPVGDDLLEGYDHKEYFMSKLNSFVESANQAINETNPKRACAKWQKHFGDRFACHNAPDYDENATSFGAPVIVKQNAKSA
jgi:hypothetical protein